MIEHTTLTLAIDLSDVLFVLRQGLVEPSEESPNSMSVMSQESNVFPQGLP
jgi:hypothetical protein